MKTPEEIAIEAIQWSTAHVSGKGVLYQYDDLEVMLIRAIEADRAQREYPVIVTEDANGITRVVALDPADAYDIVRDHLAAGYMRAAMRWEYE